MSIRVLAVDVGGTKVAVGVYEWHAGKLRARRSQRFPSADHGSLATILDEFVGSDAGAFDAVGVGVAGPVEGDTARVTSLPWVIETDDLRSRLGCRRVHLINDLEATAYGIPTLGPRDLLTMQAGRRVAGTAAVIAAGTGLGEAVLWWDGHRLRPAPSEGGHVEFAPQNALEDELLAYLRGRFVHVSYERVVSGPGLFHIYEFLRDSGRASEPHSLAARLRRDDPPGVIAAAALGEGIPICVQALDIFAAIYGAEAGNLALKVLATGGVYVAGGIAPKIKDKLTDGVFVAAFNAKGRMSRIQEAIPVRLVLRADTALRGAAHRAARAALDDQGPRGAKGRA